MRRQFLKTCQYYLKKIFFSSIVLFAINSCTDVPEKITVISDRQVRAISGCVDSHSLSASSYSNSEKTQLGLTFRVLSWNIYKGFENGWLEDLQRFADQSDLLILQEGRLSSDLLDFVAQNRYHWQIVNAFRLNGKICGVLSASKVQPSSQCGIRQREPWLMLPKTSLATLYELQGYDQQLLIINMHMVNFTFGQKAFKAQLTSLHSITEEHDGPIILAGDLNTWNSKRLDIVKGFCSDLGLQEVTFLDDKRTTRFGLEIDQMWYKGLNVKESYTEEVSSSDHNPLIVTFDVVL